MSKDKKEKILKHAKRLFAETGYEGCAMDKLASFAGVNKATIYYYFNSKEKLYNAVFQDSIECVRKDIENKLDDINNPKNALKVYIDAFYFHAKKDETFTRILMYEIASNGKHFSKEVVETFVSVVTILDNILLKGYKRGVFYKHDTNIVHFMIIGTISYFIASGPIRKVMQYKFPNMQDFFENDKNVSDTLYNIILNGLERNV